MWSCSEHSDSHSRNRYPESNRSLRLRWCASVLETESSKDKSCSGHPYSRQYILSRGIPKVLQDYVCGKWIAREVGAPTNCNLVRRKRVVDRIGQLRKISGPHGSSGHGKWGVASGICLWLAQPLISGKEEQ